MTDDTIVVTLGTKVAVLDPSGRVICHPAITPERAENAPMDGRLLAWLDGANEDVLHLVDLDTGKERWHATTAHRGESVIFGNTSIGVLTVEGVELHHLGDGALGYHRIGPKVVDARYRDGTFVFVDDDGLIESVDEAGDTQRWSVDEKQHHLEDGNFVHIDGGDVVAFGDLIDLATGKARPRPEPKHPRKGFVTEKVARTNEGFTLVGEDQGMALVDPHDELVWRSTEWERFFDPYGLTGTAITWTGNGVVTLELKDRDLMKYSDRWPRLVGFDTKTGHVRYDRAIGADDEIVGGNDECIGFLAEGSAARLQCLDMKTGTARWEHAGGTYARAWHIKRQWIVASGSPAKLEAIDNTGKVLWTTMLPDTAVAKSSITGLLAHAGTPTEEMWQLGPSYFLLTSAHDVSILDLTTGKLATVTP